jgi:hypothetical protein
VTLGLPPDDFVTMRNLLSGDCRVYLERLRWRGAGVCIACLPAQAMPNPRLNDNQINDIVAYFEALKAEQKKGP